MRILYWKYNDGKTWIPEILRTNIAGDTEFEEELVGWHCWAYECENENIVQWMKDNMTGSYECDWRFNSGDPMHTIHIRSDEDATLFKLRWM